MKLQHNRGRKERVHEIRGKGRKMEKEMVCGEDGKFGNDRKLAKDIGKGTKVWKEE